jgi:2-polyprenyl-3-methyl-5-hydroxy-6-metoxy-1,4-benzoquinol methylase
MLDGVYYDGDNYWLRTAESKWEPHAEREMSRHLKVFNGLSPDRIEGKTVVEIGGGIGLLSLHMGQIAKWSNVAGNKRRLARAA